MGIDFAAQNMGHVFATLQAHATRRDSAEALRGLLEARGIAATYPEQEGLVLRKGFTPNYEGFYEDSHVHVYHTKLYTQDNIYRVVTIGS